MYECECLREMSAESVALRVEAQKREIDASDRSGRREFERVLMSSSGLHRYDLCVCASYRSIRPRGGPSLTRRDAIIFFLRHRRENIYFWGKKMSHRKIALREFVVEKEKKSTIRSFELFERTK